MRNSMRLLATCAAVWLCAIAVPLGRGSAQGPVASSDPAASVHTTELRRYCVSCHNDRLRTAGFSLDGVDAANPGANPVLWEKVVQKLRSRAMPPAQSARPDDATYDGLATWLEAGLDRAALVRPNPARPLLHRMN